ncbi:MAG: hypothetical protein JWO81_1560 [Alphaproteobacteria bacterium]|nr:hypothetical protein [Alphaproteobacteria bacterium]
MRLRADNPPRPALGRARITRDLRAPRAGRLVIFICAFLVSAQTLPDEVVETSPGNFACSAGAGRFERHPLPGIVGNELHGRIRLIESAKSDRWSSSGALVFQLDHGITGVFVSNPAQDPSHLYIAVKRPTESEMDVIARAPADASVEVSTSLENGVLTVTSGRISRRVRIGLVAVVGPRLHCQSGRFAIQILPSSPAEGPPAAR